MKIPRLHLPVNTPTDVIPYLGASHHYKEGRSARLVVEAWYSQNDIPIMVKQVLDQEPRFADAALVDAFLERRTELGDGLKPSQTDVLAVVGLKTELAVMAVEGKVDESFGPTVAEWLVGASWQKERRLARLAATLGLDVSVIGPVRYQLLHRAASAIYEAHRYRAKVAVLMVHSFDPRDAGSADYTAFAATMRLPNAAPTLLAGPVNCDGVELYLGWAADRPSNEGFNIINGRKSDAEFFEP